MAGRNKKNEKDIDPEVLQRMKFHSKCRFRAIGRMVMSNTYWLIEATDEYQGVEDVKRRVAQAVRGKTKKKRLLSITDKALLNKPAEDRTESEKKYIYRIIGGLKCFKRYPNHVKKKLAAVTYFKYYGPGRVIVRQHQEAHGMYFIVTGDVVVSHMVYDDLLKQDVSVDLGVMHAGDMFGEVSLLHNIPRTATCTTAGHCELLLLMKADFKTVLQASVQKQWDEVRDAMSKFSYFDALDEVARREGCIVAKMKTYSENETMLGDGVGVFNFVYFILSGRCQMIESLQVVSKEHLGRTTYTLYDPYIPEEESEQDFDVKYFANYKDKEKNVSSVSFQNGSEISKMSVKPDISTGRTSETRTSGIMTSESKTSVAKTSETKTSLIKTSVTKTSEGSIVSGAIKVPSAMNSKTSKRSSIELPRRSNTRGSIQNSNKEILEVTLEEPENEDADTNTAQRDQDILEPKNQKDYVRFSLDMKVEPVVPPPNLKTYFMQVCQFNPGSTFGFGENMRDRRIVALTPVECMLLPKMWLLQRNTANIWSRIEHYLEKNIPKKKQLFKEFVSERRWQDYRDSLVQNIVERCNTVNWTSIHDVPYSIRMEEMLNI